jgi:hypothetical protein
MAAEYAKYGVTDGMLINEREGRSCGVIVKGWPGWCFAAITRGWKVKLIIVKDNEWEEEIKVWFPAAKVINWSEVVMGEISSIQVDVWFTDMDPPRKLNVWVTETLFIVTMRRARSVPQDWKYQAITLMHRNCGGVTTGEWTLYIYSRSNSPVLSPVGKVAGRDLSTILNTKLEGMPCPKPPAFKGNDCGVHEVRPKTYHGGGLLPWGATNAKVVAPCIFSSTGWVRRQLAGSEVLKALDIPDELEGILASKQIKAICHDTTLLPLKVAIRIIDALPNQHTGLPEPPTMKRPKLGSSNTPPLSCSEVPDQGAVACAVDRNAKATKSDDAAVPEFLWDRAISPSLDPAIVASLGVIRKTAHRWWNRRLEREFFSWFRSEYPLVCIISLVCNNPHHRNSVRVQRDWDAGMDCLRRSRGSNWWEWSDGSRPYYWRWPIEYREIIRDGLPIWELDTLPTWLVPQRGEKVPYMHAAVRAKLIVVRGRRYIIPGTVRSLTFLFAVPKGEHDIRLVYDGTKSGLNRSVWAPWFPLPTIETHLRCVEAGSFMGDIDIGEMFLNFMLHPRMQQYAGVDVTPFFPEELGPDRQLIWEHWGRCGMGFLFSPYQAVQGVLFADMQIRGDRFNPSNVFRWDRVILNLPGSETYSPSRSWVYKIRSDGALASDFTIYVDDVRTMGSTAEDERLAARAVASTLNSLGLQDAARKRREGSQTPGAWAGSIVLTSDGMVSIAVSQERWDKSRMILTWLHDHITSGLPIPFKTLESHRGFLIYIVRTYPAINPYLKGIHLTLDSWRPWRKDDGWRMTLAEMRAVLQDNPDFDSVGTGEKAPALVHPVPRLQFDIEALLQLFSSESPPRRHMRLSSSAVAVYQFGDASGAGFGSSLFVNGSLYYRHGQWTSAFSDESSNFRELANLVHAIEEAHSKGLLENSELFVFTDNSAAEGAFYKGTSPSRRLFELVLRLRTLQMSGSLALHVIHVAGKRMIAQGTDALSRGITTAGVMAGMEFSSFVPLHLSVQERQDPCILHQWVTSWAGDAFWLAPEDWFLPKLVDSPCVWTPPPAAADAALDQLGKWIHMRPSNTSHIFIAPRLMTSRWRKFLGKACDLVFTVPIGTDIWHYSQFEPLIVGISFPLSRHKPWRLRGTPMLESVERALREVPQATAGWGGCILRELFLTTRSLDSMSTGMVRKMLHPAG